MKTVRQDIVDLLRQGVPQIRIARQLGVATRTVRRTREAIGMPARRRGHPDTYTSLQDAFLANTEPTDDGHLRWTGYTHPRTGSQYLCFRQDRPIASKVAFTLHHGRPPVGHVRPGCGMDGCVAGGHLEDRQIRDANERADEAFDAIFGAVAS